MTKPARDPKNPPSSNRDSRILEAFAPPQNIEAEKWVIGGILNSAEAMPVVDMLLSPDMFYFGAHAKIYTAIKRLYDTGIPIDAMTLAEELDRRDHLEAVGGIAALMDFATTYYTAVNVDHYAATIKEAYHRRKLLAFADQVRSMAMAKDQPLQDLTNQAQSALGDLSAQIFDTGTGSVSRLGTVAASHVSSISEIWEAKQRGETVLSGYPTGFYDYDAMTGGLVPQTLTIVAGRPSMGKTSWAVQAAINAAKNSGVPALIFSMEMSKESLVYRIMSGESKTRHTDYGITASDLRNAKFNESDLAKIAEIAYHLNQYDVGIDDRPNLTVAEIHQTALQWKQAHGGRLGVIVIDYLQLMGTGNPATRVQELDAICNALAGISKKLNVAIVLLSQLSRSCESRTDKRPVASDLRDSGGIEQAADVIVCLYREEHYNPETTERGIAELIIRKQRNGPIGTVKTLFEPRLTSFSNIQSQPTGF